MSVIKRGQSPGALTHRGTVPVFRHLFIIMKDNQMALVLSIN